MSISAMQWALRQPLNGCQKFVLFILGYHANESAQCWPGLETIAEECGISRTTTICHINEISALGLISKKHRCDNRGYRRSTLYTLHLDCDIKIQSKRFQRRKNQRRDFESQGKDFDVSNVRNLDGNIIERSLEQTIEQTNIHRVSNDTPTKTNQSSSNEINEIFQHWQKIMKHPLAKLDCRRKKKINEALKLGYTTEQMKQAINGCSLSPYHTGNNPENKYYDSIDLIFRNADKIEQFIAYSTTPPTNKGKSNNTDLLAGVI